MSYKIGDILEGQITGIQPYGAFVSLDDKTQGLIHISEVQSGYTKNIHDILSVGETVKVQIIDIDEYSQKISLSKRTLEKNYIKKALPEWIEEAVVYLHSENHAK